jgi:hypothetical protein
MAMFKSTIFTLTVVGLASLAARPVAAQEQGLTRAAERLEITMTLLPDKAADAADITKHIELPSAPGPAAAAGKRPDDLPGAEHGKGEGLDTASEARERGREFGQEVAEQARQNRENAGRGPDSPPGPPADLPVTPGNGGPPDTVPVPAPGNGKP